MLLLLLLATLGAQARCGAAAASPSVDKNVRRFISYPLSRSATIAEMWITLGRIARKRILFVANKLHADALARENTIQETP